MLGEILGLGSAAVAGGTSTFTRRGTFLASSNYIANMSILCGPVFFVLASLVSGEIFKLGTFTWQVYFFFSLTGIIHFACGRTFGYRAIQLIGSNRSNVVTGMNVIITVLLAIVVLNEKLTPLATLGIILSMAGPLLMAFKERTVSGGASKQASSAQARPKAGAYGRDIDRRTLIVGSGYAVGSALFWGTSPITLKMGLDQGGSPIVGSLIAYLAATLAVSPWILNREGRTEILSPAEGSLRFGLLTGLTTSTAQLLRYSALASTSVVTVSLMTRTIPVWVLLYAFLFNRKHESFSRWVLLGNVLVVIGTVLVVI